MSPKQERVREIYESSGGQPELVVLESNIATDKSAFTREIFWMEIFAMVGARLTNASVDYDGVYFLADYHLSSLSNSTTDLDDDSSNAFKDKKLSWKVGLKPAEKHTTSRREKFLDDAFFQVELCESFGQKSEIVLLDLAKKRTQNIAAGRLKNHGFPVTEEELSLLVKRIRRGDTVSQIVNYFQRSESSIRSILRRQGFDIQFDYTKNQGN